MPVAGQMSLPGMHPAAAPLKAGEWTRYEDSVLRAMYATNTREQIAAALRRSEGSVRSRCSTLGLNSKVAPWSDEEIAALRLAYSAECTAEMRLSELAARFGRNAGNISRKARGLGLTDRHRVGVRPADRKIRRPKFATKEELSADLSRRAREYIRVHGHPRGALGMKHTPETKAAQSTLARGMWADPNHKINSAENKQRLSDNMVKNVLAGKMLAGPKAYSRAAAGKRPDLNDRYFRSSWEANYARYLNLLVTQGQISEWDYECQTFQFEKISRGTRCYTPDFKVTFPDGHHEWHEVKGWMDDKSRVRLERMARYYPAEVVKVIGADWFKSANRGVAYVIPTWERGGKKAA